MSVDLSAMVIEVQRELPAAPEQVWDALADLPAMTRFSAEVVELVWTRATYPRSPSGPGPGARARAGGPHAPLGGPAYGDGGLAGRPRHRAARLIPGRVDRGRKGYGIEHQFDTEGEGTTVADKDAVDRPAEKDPDQWVTGNEPVTGPQESYLSTLAQQTGEDVDPKDLTKAEASRKIDELQDKRGG